MEKIRTYSELLSIPTFEERYDYLKLDGVIGETTFGFDRYMNQRFYQNDPEWKRIRDYVILRDASCDLAIPEREIQGHVIIHHMNPITKYDIMKRTEFLLDPEYLVCVLKSTHDAIHYGDKSKLVIGPVERTINDTCPWRK